MNTQQIRLFAVLVTLMLVVGLTSSTEAGTTELSDCGNMPSYPPTNGDVNAACINEGSCPDVNYEYQATAAWRCHYTITTQADPEGDWVFDRTTQTDADACQSAVGDCEGNSAQSIESVTTAETATTSTGVSLSTATGLAVKAALLGEVSVEVEAGFTTSTSSSSSVEKTFGQTGTISAPCCGYKEGYMSAFLKDMPASGTLVMRLQVQCLDADGQLCDGTNWHIVLSDSINVSLAAKDTSSKWKICDATCSSVHQCCDGSSTTTPVPPCQYMVHGP